MKKALSLLVGAVLITAVACNNTDDAKKKATDDSMKAAQKADSMKNAMMAAQKADSMKNAMATDSSKMDKMDKKMDKMDKKMDKMDDKKMDKKGK